MREHGLARPRLARQDVQPGARGAARPARSAAGSRHGALPARSGGLPPGPDGAGAFGAVLSRKLRRVVAAARESNGGHVRRRGASATEPRATGVESHEANADATRRRVAPTRVESAADATRRQAGTATPLPTSNAVAHARPAQPGRSRRLPRRGLARQPPEPLAQPVVEARPRQLRQAPRTPCPNSTWMSSPARSSHAGRPSTWTSTASSREALLIVSRSSGATTSARAVRECGAMNETT